MAGSWPGQPHEWAVGGPVGHVYIMEYARSLEAPGVFELLFDAADQYGSYGELHLRRGP